MLIPSAEGKAPPSVMFCKARLSILFGVPITHIFGITACDYDVVVGENVLCVVLTRDGRWTVEDTVLVDMDGPYAHLVYGSGGVKMGYLVTSHNGELVAEGLTSVAEAYSVAHRYALANLTTATVWYVPEFGVRVQQAHFAY